MYIVFIYKILYLVLFVVCFGFGFIFIFFTRSSENDQLRTLNLEQRLSLGSDDEVDLVQELQSMCSSKSEPDISKVNIRLLNNLHNYHMQLFATCLK